MNSRTPGGTLPVRGQVGLDGADNQGGQIRPHLDRLRRQSPEKGPRQAHPDDAVVGSHGDKVNSRY